MFLSNQEIVFRVLIDQEKQYAIWPERKAIPDGWTDIGVLGCKQACLDHVDMAWLDMCPLSGLHFMEQRMGTLTVH
ncbi:MbtH family protein [Janthinobacterium fluminis]|uniref:MbtH family NRPS accessory protein n=1 Tax=Janthinobacterium fluminis TaxID=2987524 RepID=A0ABT5K435_9BURK|nr:MbtH family NRPS accessory protein [Janthinobacterium fluminis]MDC8759757.1 MbtH family NRPS accessory protein [Janthinobacterium fluminis]